VKLFKGRNQRKRSCSNIARSEPEAICLCPRDVRRRRWIGSGQQRREVGQVAELVEEDGLGQRVVYHAKTWRKQRYRQSKVTFYDQILQLFWGLKWQLLLTLFHDYLISKWGTSINDVTQFWIFKTTLVTKLHKYCQKIFELLDNNVIYVNLKCWTETRILENTANHSKKAIQNVIRVIGIRP